MMIQCLKILTNNALPTDNPFYRYLLEVAEGGITHKEFSDKITKNTNVMHEIEEKRHQLPHCSTMDESKWIRKGSTKM